MNCQDFRDPAIEFAASPALLGSSALAHSESCEPCAATWQRLRVQASALGRLQRVGAPDELDGRVVAAAQAGYREDRAVRHVRGLPTVDAPSELERRVADLLTPRLAPAVLARLVAEDAEDPARALARRFTCKVGKRPAPGELDERMTRGIDATASSSFTWRRAVALAAGLLLTAWVGIATVQQLTTPETSKYDFEVREMASVDDLSPFARQMVGGFLGGALEARAQ
jgi:hypothetical protein